jgi:sarcosine oxidase subunit beta
VRNKADVVIVGGGVNGCMLGYQLSRAGLDVVIVEKRYLGSGATGSCGAGIRQQWSTRENTELAIKSVKMFERLSDEFGEDIEFRQGGYLIINHSEQELEQAKKNVTMQQSLGLDVSIIDKERITEIVPILDIKGIHACAATFCPTDGHANPFKTTFAAAHAAQREGATIHTHTKVTSIRTKNKAITAVKTEKGTIKTSWLVNAAGVWSQEIAQMVGITLPNQPFRKEAIATERLQPMFEAMVISFKDGIYFSQQKEGQIVGGVPIPEEKKGFYTQPTFSFLQHMSRTLTRYAPALKKVNMLRHWTGFYDVTPDARPILGPDERVKGFIHCHGFSGHGFMLSPMVSKVLADFISNGTTSKVLKNLHIKRFKGKVIIREQSVVG